MIDNDYDLKHSFDFNGFNSQIIVSGADTTTIFTSKKANSVGKKSNNNDTCNSN